MLIEKLEVMCDVEKPDGEWITKLDLVEEGTALKVVDVGKVRHAGYRGWGGGTGSHQCCCLHGIVARRSAARGDADHTVRLRLEMGELPALALEPSFSLARSMARACAQRMAKRRS